MNFEGIEKFIIEFKKISEKIKPEEKTLFEVSGISHHENVISNILAFYFNPKEEHKLNDLLICSLLKVAKRKNKKISTDIDTLHFNVYREYKTLKGNRIDILLENDEIVMGIENKIYASLYNDLDDYSKTLDEINKRSIKILLTLNKIDEKFIKSGFINITYHEFLFELSNDLKKYKDINNKWYIYLNDFINNMERIEVNNKMENEINDWINKHKREIKDFYKLLNTAQNNINKQIQNYEIKFNEKTKNKEKIKHYLCGTEVANTAYIVFDFGCNLDVKLNTEKWRIGIYAWKKEIQNNIKKYLDNKNIKYFVEEDHLWIYSLDYYTPVEEIVAKSADIYKNIKEFQEFENV